MSHQARSVPNSQSTAQESLGSERQLGGVNNDDAEKVKTSSDLVKTSPESPDSVRR
jgi:hypothetical protein